WRAMDWGKTRPYSVGWYTVDPDGVVYRYKELYGWGGEPNVGTSESPKMIAKKIIDMEKHERAAGLKFQNNPADQSCFYSRGEGITIIELFRDEGILWTPSKGGPNSRINGWNVVNQMLHDGTLKVFSNCRHLIRTLPSLQIDQTKPEDVDTNMEDHAADELRYSLVSRHKYRPGLSPTTRHAYMSMDYMLDLDDDSVKKSIYRF
ncbi:MAG: terminase, partial [candidate division Zixibacteria bacterium]